MSKVVLLIFSLLSIGAIYSTYRGVGLQEVVSENQKSIRTHHSSSRSSSGGWSFGK
ncbi:MAG: hypothetical protein Q9M36_04260 [Sulfurovum sp.]|nr:hypothetical protein [Sulfurovum sp.]